MRWLEFINVIIILAKTTAAQNEDALSYYKVRGLYTAQILTTFYSINMELKHNLSQYMFILSGTVRKSCLYCPEVMFICLYCPEVIFILSRSHFYTVRKSCLSVTGRKVLQSFLLIVVKTNYENDKTVLYLLTLLLNVKKIVQQQTE